MQAQMVHEQLPVWAVASQAHAGYLYLLASARHCSADMVACALSHVTS